MSANLLETVNTGLGRRTSQAPERHDFSKIKTAVPIPNLIEIQRESYNRFLQMDLLPEERQNNYGQFLLTMLEQDTSDLQLSDVQVREIRHRLSNPEVTISEFEAMEFFTALM